MGLEEYEENEENEENEQNEHASLRMRTDAMLFQRFKDSLFGLCIWDETTRRAMCDLVIVVVLLVWVARRSELI